MNAPSITSPDRSSSIGEPMITKLQSSKIHVAVAQALGINRQGALDGAAGQAKSAWAELLAEAHLDNGQRLRRCAQASKRLNKLAKEQFGGQVFVYGAASIARGLDLSNEDAVTAIRLAGAVNHNGRWVSGLNGPPVGLLDVRECG